MPNLTQVTLVSGKPQESGTVSTLDAVLATQATAAAQATGNSSLSSIDTKLSSQATAAKQDTGNTSLASIDTKVTGVATAANQTAANSSLSSIDTKLTGVATAADQATGNASLGSIDTKLSSQATAANQSTANTSLSSIDGKLTLTKGAGAADANTIRMTIDSSQVGSLGRAAASASAPVALSNEDLAALTALAITATANGLTFSRVNSAATTNATSLKASAGQFYHIDVFNVAAYDVFLKIYDKASAPTVGTDTPVWTIPVKAGAGYSKEFSLGRPLSTGFAYAITKLQADSDTTAVAAGDLTGSIGWK